MSCSKTASYTGRNIPNICIRNINRSNYPTGSGRSGSSNGSGGSGGDTEGINYGVPAYQLSPHALNTWNSGANYDYAKAGFHCHSDKELAFKMAFSAITESTSPAPCEFLALPYDDYNQAMLKSMYNTLVREIFDPFVPGKVIDSMVGTRAKELMEKIRDNNEALKAK